MSRSDLLTDMLDELADKSPGLSLDPECIALAMAMLGPRQPTERQEFDPEKELTPAELAAYRKSFGIWSRRRI